MLSKLVIARTFRLNRSIRRSFSSGNIYLIFSLTCLIIFASTAELEMPKTDYEAPEYTGLSKSDVLEQRRNFINPASFLYYKGFFLFLLNFYTLDPIMLVDGYM